MGQIGMKATLKSIAEEAGVSVSTVSYVLNRHGRITKESHRKIIEIAEKYNYVPDAKARSLVTGVTNNIGLMINKNADALFEQQYITKCITEFGNALEQYSGWLSLCMAREVSTQKMRQYLTNANFDGIIFLHANNPRQIVDLLKDRVIPCAFINASFVDGAVANITCDDEKGIGMAVEHLVRLGYREILYLASKDPNDVHEYDVRRVAFEKAAREDGLEKADVLYTGLAYEGIHKAWSEYLTTHDTPLAVIAASDEIAWETFVVLASRGINPRSVSIVGFDDVNIEKNEQLGLTTIRQPMGDIVRSCIDYIYRSIEQHQIEPYAKVWSPELVVRTSTYACKSD